MKDFQVIYERNHIVAFNKLLINSFPLHLFDPEYLQSNGLLNQSLENYQGRGSVKYFSFNGIEMVLRHYHRGGLPAKVSNDHYFWAGLEKSRAMQELRMLSELHSKNLPVPVPVAAHIAKSKCLYRADIVTVCIPEAKTLAQRLNIEALDEQIWKTIGRTIKRFHAQHCNHADLNANNILLSGQENVYLIDFDRSKLDSSKNGWQEKNLKRLRRSLEKLSTNLDRFYYSAENFSSLIKGYQSY